jgi:hypothetical protein
MEREQLEDGKTNRCHRTEAVSLRQIVDGAYDQLLYALQLIGPGGPERDRHFNPQGKASGDTSVRPEPFKK